MVNQHINHDITKVSWMRFANLQDQRG